MNFNQLTKEAQKNAETLYSQRFELTSKGIEFNADGTIHTAVRFCRWCEKPLYKNDDMVCGYHHLEG